ncbi:MAG: LPS assembly lipoprotein LptE [Pseudomonadota bacterium]
MVACAFALAVMGACGFEPAFRAAGGASALIGTTQIQDPSDRDGFDFVRHLETQLGAATQARHVLDWSLSVRSEGIAITSAQETTRIDLIGTASYTLRELASGQILQSGSVRGFTGYASSGITAASRTDETSARGRLMVILADRVVTELLAGS